MNTKNLRRLLRIRTKALKLALKIMRNDAYGMEFNFPESSKAMLRWVEELMAEAELRKL